MDLTVDEIKLSIEPGPDKLQKGGLNNPLHEELSTISLTIEEIFLKD